MGRFVSLVFLVLLTFFVCSQAQSLPPTLDLIATLRDFAASGQNAPLLHPDFQSFCCSQVNGIAANTLPADKKPVLANPNKPTYITSADSYAAWYRDTPYNQIPGSNPPQYYTRQDVITLTREGDTNVYSYYNGAFFPLNGWGFGNYPGTSRNYHFTMEIHASFGYLGESQTFQFCGDDDIWVYINNYLVMDIGGVHPQVCRSFTLDSSLASRIGLVAGNVYDFDFYFAERHTTESNFKMQTTIILTCPLCEGKDCGAGTCDCQTGCCVCNPTCSSSQGQCGTCDRCCGNGNIEPGEQCEPSGPDSACCVNCQINSGQICGQSSEPCKQLVCTAGRPVGQACQPTAVPDGQTTNCAPDDSLCTEDYCIGGVCSHPVKAGLQCTSPPGECYNTQGTCNPATGQCSYTVRNGEPCSAALCHTAVCNSEGFCVDQGPITCQPPDWAIGLDPSCGSQPPCDPGTGQCPDFVLTGSCCGNLRVDPGEQCDSTSVCCSDCNFAAGGTNCTQDMITQGMSNDVIQCTVAICNSAGACQLSNKPDGTPCSSASSVSSPECNTFECQGGTCVAVPVQDKRACDDGNLCTSGTTCNPTNGLCECGNGCTPATCPPKTCQKPGVCNPADGSCTYSPVPPGTPCDNPNPDKDNDCTQFQCDESGECITACSGKVCGNGVLESGEQCELDFSLNPPAFPDCCKDCLFLEEGSKCGDAKDDCPKLRCSADGKCVSVDDTCKGGSEDGGSKKADSTVIGLGAGLGSFLAVAGAAGGILFYKKAKSRELIADLLANFDQMSNVQSNPLFQQPKTEHANALYEA